MNKAPWSDTNDFKFTTDNSVTSGPKGGEQGLHNKFLHRKDLPQGLNSYPFTTVNSSYTFHRKWYLFYIPTVYLY